MSDVLRLIDAAIGQASEPVNCSRCAKPLTGKENVLYFCSARCQAFWQAQQPWQVGFVIDPSRLERVPVWVPDFPTEPDVRYPVADNGGARDAENRAHRLPAYSKPVEPPLGDYLMSLELWLSDPCGCAKCLGSLSQVISAVWESPGRPRFAQNEDGWCVILDLPTAAVVDLVVSGIKSLRAVLGVAVLTEEDVISGRV